MDIASIKLTLVERLMLVWDEAALQRIAKAIETEIPEASEEEEAYTDEEIAELDRRQARYISGESRSYTREEALRMMREGSKE
jgi:DNA primase large subunit